MSRIWEERLKMLANQGEAGDQMIFTYDTKKAAWSARTAAYRERTRLMLDDITYSLISVAVDGTKLIVKKDNETPAVFVKANGETFDIREMLRSKQTKESPDTARLIRLMKQDECTEDEIMEMLIANGLSQDESLKMIANVSQEG